MLITYQKSETGGLYVATTQYSDRDVIKKAGFMWNPETRKWWTKFPARAALLRDYCDDAALTALSEHIGKVEASRATTSEAEIPSPDGLAYLPFQKAGIAYAAEKTACLIADEPGLGKTIQALGVINQVGCLRILVVCPTSLRLNWKKETEKWLVRPAQIDIPDAKTWRPARVAFGTPYVVICNYERLTQLKEVFLADPPWDLLIVDEAHYAKNPAAKRSKAVYEIAARSKRKLFLTGTPVLNKPIELHPIVAACDKDRFGNFWHFAHRYCGAHKEPRYTPRGVISVWNVDGATNLEELQERLRASIMVRRLKKDVYKELPPKRRSLVHLDVAFTEGERIKEYLYALEAAESEAELAAAEGNYEEWSAAVKKLKYEQQVAFTDMSEYRHKMALAKTPAAIEYVKTLLESGVEKIIFFAHHKDVMEAVCKELTASGIQNVAVNGDVKPEERQVAVDRFQNDAVVRVFVGGIMAAGVGLTLTAASHVVFLELDWVPANVTQAEDRAHRIGQTDTVFIHQLIIDNTLDAHMVKKVVAKQEIADKALDIIPEWKAASGKGSGNSEAKIPTAMRRTPEPMRQLLLTALRGLSSACDGAHAKDGAGFNSNDSAFGKKLSALADLTDGQYLAGWKMVRKYRRQIAKDVYTTLYPNG